jgi:KDO2-lipid IV(A) lauroyltransferase
VICGSSWSTGEPLRYRGAFAPPIVPWPGEEGKEEAHRIVVEMNRQLEGFVRAHPEQWNWIHPRWETRPPVPEPDPALR